MAIEAIGLTKRYGAVTAAERVSLRVEHGEIYALVGLNGAGKTTIIRMLLGMVRPTEGSVSLLGVSVASGQRSIWSRVGYLMERPAAYPELTVGENLEVTRRLRKLNDRRAVDAIIERLALAPYADRRAQTLSLGNVQRLGLAKALIHRPELLILDEPANGLDPAGVVEIRNLLRELAAEHGVTVLLSSHILAEVARLATRVGILHQGRLLQELAADVLDRRARHRLVVEARDGAAARAALTRSGFEPSLDGDTPLVIVDERAIRHPEEVATVLVEAGCPPTKLVVEQEDLEAYFLRLVDAAEDDGNA